MVKSWPFYLPILYDWQRYNQQPTPPSFSVFSLFFYIHDNKDSMLQYQTCLTYSRNNIASVVGAKLKASWTDILYLARENMFCQEERTKHKHETGNVEDDEEKGIMYIDI